MDYKLTQRKGRNVQVSFDNGKTWASTGCKTKEEAVVILERSNNKKLLKLRDYAENFYTRTDVSSYRVRKEAHGRKLIDGTYEQKQSILNKYIMTRFGDCYLSEITPLQIEDYILLNTLDRHNDSKNRILLVLREIFDKAVIDGYVTTNPARAVRGISKANTPQPVLTQKESEIICPNNVDEAIKIWENIYIAGVFYVMRDTGFRPSEAIGLSWDSINFGDKTVFTDKQYSSKEAKIVNRIKTTNTGKKYKVGILSDTTIILLKRIKRLSKSQYVFLYRGEGFSYEDRICARLKAVCFKYLRRTDITPKCFRHLFMTNLIGKMPKEVIMEFMGHTQYEQCYDDRTKEMIIEQAIGMLKKYQDIS